jgi:hypothetical protein
MLPFQQTDAAEIRPIGEWSFRARWEASPSGRIAERLNEYPHRLVGGEVLGDVGDR